MNAATDAVTNGSKEDLVKELAHLITDAVNLHHIQTETLGADTSLRQGGLGLDSVDILEAVVVIEQKYGLKVSNVETGKKYFRTLGTIADFILEGKGTA